MSLLQQKKYKLKKKKNNNNNLKKPLYLLLTRGIIIVAICDVDLVVALLSSCRVSRLLCPRRWRCGFFFPAAGGRRAMGVTDYRRTRRGVTK